MGYAILRIAKRKTAGSGKAMLTHALREVEVPNAIPGAPKPTAIAGHQSSQAALAALADGIALAKAQGGRQGFTKASTPVLDLLVTTSHQDMQRLTREQQDSYFRRSLGFIAAKFGGMANILTAVIHRDESTPHMQVLLMPLDRTTMRFAASKMIGGPPGLSAIQDAFHEQCGKPFGLERGEKGSRATHVPIKAFYAHMAAGESPPAMAKVPPAPTFWDKLRPAVHQAKEKARGDALTANKKAREDLLKQAKTGRMLHPKVVARQAEKYRENVRLDALNKAAMGQAQATLRLAEFKETRAIEAEGRLKKMDAKMQAQALDKFTRHMAPEFVGVLSKRLGVDLEPGKGLCDQLRRAGLAPSLLAAAQLIEDASDGKAMAAAQTWHEQPQNAPRGPSPG